VLANLAAYDPGSGLDDRNLPAFLYALEGVSHFVYAAVCAQGARAVSALELELQAEVDKYVTCLLAGDAAPGRSAAWRARLYEQHSYEPDLDADERDRYRVANDNARALRRVARAAVRGAAGDRRHVRRATPILPPAPGRQARRHRPRRVTVAAAASP
jgi:hypothetical protein